jgi:hypothetical protein
LGKQRPRYPDWLYQRLRKEANFGCAKCGVPIVRIHHIEGYKEDVFKPEELIQLCDTHHEMADKGTITKSVLYALKDKPFNFDRVHHAFQIPESQRVVAHLGQLTFIDTPIALQILNEPIISTRREGSQLLLSAVFYDQLDIPRLTVTDNVWDADTGLFDVRYSENEAGADAWLAIKMHESEPYLNVKVVKGEVDIKGKFYKRGALFEVLDDGTFQFGKRHFIRAATIIECNVGLSVN